MTWLEILTSFSLLTEHLHKVFYHLQAIHKEKAPIPEASHAIPAPADPSSRSHSAILDAVPLPLVSLSSNPLSAIVLASASAAAQVRARGYCSSIHGLQVEKRLEVAR